MIYTYKLLLLLSGVSAFLSGFMFIRLMPNGTTSEIATSLVGCLISVSAFSLFVWKRPKNL
jgi:hypothetical protein